MVIDGNHVTGPSITQENIGIFVDQAASARVTNNTVTNNQTGIALVVGNASAYRISGNTLQNNPVGIEAFAATKAQIVNNILTTGSIGIEDSGTDDMIQGNFMCHYTTPIDTSEATNPIVSGNHTNC